MLNRSLSQRVMIVTALAALWAALPVVGAAMLKFDAAKSSVSAVLKQLNVPVEGKFKKFNAQIDFNQSKPESSKASVEIDLGSFDLGDPEMNKEVLKKEWFNAGQFPKASFVSSAMKNSAPGKLDVTGKLTIKGKTADVSFQLTVKQEAGKQVYEGALPIKRLAFNIGEGDWKDTSMVADEVLIKFHVVGTL